jgi:uncharacterized membrane protein HdeD (DUF308 family)
MSTAPQSASESPLEANTLRDQLQHLRDHWLLLLVLGVALVLVGTFAIISAFIATLATVALFGTLLFVGAIFQLVNALTCRNWRGFLVFLLTAILYGVVGLVMMNHPVAAALGLTLMLAAAFMAGGIIRIVVAAIEHFHSWGWVMLNGFVNLFLGVYIWRHFPEDALWVIGLFVGIELIFSGWSWIFLALGIRRAFPRQL